MARRSILSEEDSTDIDLSPMIDCIFLLLIFFIVTTVFVEETGLQVAKPDAAASASTEDNENVVFLVTADGKVLFQDKEIALSDVTNRVKAAVKDPDVPVIIRADEKAKHGLFVSVWDAAKRGGAQTLTFSTVN